MNTHTRNHLIRFNWKILIMLSHAEHAKDYLNVWSSSSFTAHTCRLILLFFWRLTDIMHTIDLILTIFCVQYHRIFCATSSWYFMSPLFCFPKVNRLPFKQCLFQTSVLWLKPSVLTFSALIFQLFLQNCDSHQKEPKSIHKLWPTWPKRKWYLLYHWPLCSTLSSENCTPPST